MAHADLGGEATVIDEEENYNMRDSSVSFTSSSSSSTTSNTIPTSEESNVDLPTLRNTIITDYIEKQMKTLPTELQYFSDFKRVWKKFSGNSKRPVDFASVVNEETMKQLHSALLEAHKNYTKARKDLEKAQAKILQSYQTEFFTMDVKVKVKEFAEKLETFITDYYLLLYLPEEGFGPDRLQYYNLLNVERNNRDKAIVAASTENTMEDLSKASAGIRLYSGRIRGIFFGKEEKKTKKRALDTETAPGDEPVVQKQKKRKVQVELDQAKTAREELEKQLFQEQMRISEMQKQLMEQEKKVMEQEKREQLRIAEMQKQLMEQEKKVMEQEKKVMDQERQIREKEIEFLKQELASKNMEAQKKASEEKGCVICGRLSSLMDPIHRVPICDEMCQEEHYTKNQGRQQNFEPNNISSKFRKLAF